MARKFPRFLFSNPKNTKSEGPFIIHTMEPRFIAKVDIIERPHLFDIELLESWDFGDVPNEDELLRDADYWLQIQIKTGAIKL